MKDDQDTAPSDDEATVVTDEQIFEELAKEENEDQEAEPNETPEEAATSEEEPEAPDDDGEDEQEEDIWAGASPEARAAYERAERQRARERGTIAGLQKKINELQAKLEGGEEEEPSEAEDDELSKLVEEYPEVAAPLIKEIKTLKAQISENFQKVQETEQAIAARESAREEELFLSEHPDGFDVISENFDKFQDWVEDQPRKIRDAYAINEMQMTDGRAAAELVAAFKQYLHPQDETQKEMPKRRQRQLQGARTVKPGGPTAPAPESSAKSEEEAYWQEFARMEAQGTL